jgi:transglutaminase-like putative cysteine protease
MKVSVTHSTVYRYDFPVYLEPHIFRLRPRTNSAQSLLAFDIRIAPTPAGTTECLDQDGTLALNAWFDGPTSELSVISRFTVEMLRENPFDYVLAGQSLRLPLWYQKPLCAALASYRNDLHIADSVKQFAQSTAASGAMEHALVSDGVEPADLSDLPPGGPALRPSLAVAPNVEFRRKDPAATWPSCSATLAA